VMAAEGGDPDATTIRVWTSHDDPPQGRRPHYNPPQDFLALVVEAAPLAAARQIGRCFECDAASIGGDYCRRHDQSVKVVCKNRHAYVIDRLYRFALPAILEGPSPVPADPD
jgi:hypothetical protein